MKNLFFSFLSYPSKQDNEEEIRPGIVEKMHKDVYYIDECTGEEAFTILLRIGDLMIMMDCVHSASAAMNQKMRLCSASIM